MWRPCIVDLGRIAYIVLVAEPLVIFILWGVNLPSRPYASSLSVWNIVVRLWDGGITVHHHAIWSVHFTPIIYNHQYLFLRNSTLFGSCVSYNFLVYLPKCITSGLSIIIWINFTRRRDIPFIIYINQYFQFIEYEPTVIY